MMAVDLIITVDEETQEKCFLIVDYTTTWADVAKACGYNALQNTCVLFAIRHCKHNNEEEQKIQSCSTSDDWDMIREILLSEDETARANATNKYIMVAKNERTKIEYLLKCEHAQLNYQRSQVEYKLYGLSADSGPCSSHAANERKKLEETVKSLKARLENVEREQKNSQQYQQQQQNQPQHNSQQNKQQTKAQQQQQIRTFLPAPGARLPADSTFSGIVNGFNGNVNAFNGNVNSFIGNTGSNITSTYSGTPPPPPFATAGHSSSTSSTAGQNKYQQSQSISMNPSPTFEQPPAATITATVSGATTRKQSRLVNIQNRNVENRSYKRRTNTLSIPSPRTSSDNRAEHTSLVPDNGATGASLTASADIQADGNFSITNTTRLIPNSKTTAAGGINSKTNYSRTVSHNDSSDGGDSGDTTCGSKDSSTPLA